MSAAKPTVERRRGPTPGIIGGGAARAPRPGRESKGPEEPTQHVDLDAIAVVSVARPLRAGDNTRRRSAADQSHLPTRLGARAALVHDVSTTHIGGPEHFRFTNQVRAMERPGPHDAWSHLSSRSQRLVDDRRAPVSNDPLLVARTGFVFRRNRAAPATRSGQLPDPAP